MKNMSIIALNKLYEQGLLSKEEKKDIEKEFNNWADKIIPFSQVKEPDIDNLDIESGEVIETKRKTILN